MALAGKSAGCGNIAERVIGAAQQTLCPIKPTLQQPAITGCADHLEETPGEVAVAETVGIVEFSQANVVLHVLVGKVFDLVQPPMRQLDAFILQGPPETFD
ncbi:MAG: hypothetical protein Q7J57_04295, partial [Gemmobacter sp.]|nr:hypothetical protein [Gemmobacter sp.]